MMLIGDMIRRDARLYGGKTGLIEGDMHFTYTELNSRTNKLANALIALGKIKEDKIAFMGNNSHQFVEFYFAAAKGGFVSIPVNSRFSADEAAYVLKDSEATLLIYGEEMEGTVQKIRELVPEIKQYVSTGN
ncbi:MAG: long-chain fatty acid--CoA ligase, partial [Deltaproteobacteria bacterium]|nr:long-chain fatty acid--CoA ligase [Deltaproteobacteria bacterium]